MAHSGPPSNTRVTWGLNAVSEREAAQPALAPAVVIYVTLNPSAVCSSTAGAAASKTFNYEMIRHGRGHAKGQGLIGKRGRGNTSQAQPGPRGGGPGSWEQEWHGDK